MCGEFLLPRAVFSFACRIGQVTPGSCASKGFNLYETSTTLNMGVIGSINVNVFTRKPDKGDDYFFPSNFGFFSTTRLSQSQKK